MSEREIKIGATYQFNNAVAVVVEITGPADYREVRWEEQKANRKTRVTPFWYFAENAKRVKE